MDKLQSEAASAFLYAFSRFDGKRKFSTWFYFVANNWIKTLLAKQIQHSTWIEYRDLLPEPKPSEDPMGFTSFESSMSDTAREIVRLLVDDPIEIISNAAEELQNTLRKILPQKRRVVPMAITQEDREVLKVTITKHMQNRGTDAEQVEAAWSEIQAILSSQ